MTGEHSTYDPKLNKNTNIRNHCLSMSRCPCVSPSGSNPGLCNHVVFRSFSYYLRWRSIVAEPSRSQYFKGGKFGGKALTFCACLVSNIPYRYRYSLIYLSLFLFRRHQHPLGAGCRHQEKVREENLHPAPGGKRQVGNEKEKFMCVLVLHNSEFHILLNENCKIKSSTTMFIIHVPYRYC